MAHATNTEAQPDPNGGGSPQVHASGFGSPRDFLGNRFVYTCVCRRAHGLSVGINMNPDRLCNFDCVYCYVDRSKPAQESKLDVPVMVAELERTLEWVHSGRMRELPNYRNLPEEL